MNKLTGAALIGQSGGPTAAINATLAGAVQAALEEELGGGCITTGICLSRYRGQPVYLWVWYVLLRVADFLNHSGEPQNHLVLRFPFLCSNRKNSKKYFNALTE